MTKQQKFNKLQELVLDRMIEDLENGKLGAMDLQTCVTFLNQNKITEERKEKEPEENIDNMVEELK